MLRVKLAIESGDAAACDWLTAASTKRALPRVEVERAKGSTVQLHETAVSEGPQAVLGQRERWGSVIMRKNRRQVETMVRDINIKANR